MKVGEKVLCERWEEKSGMFIIRETEGRAHFMKVMMVTWSKAARNIWI